MKSKRSSPKFDTAIAFLNCYLANGSKSYREVSAAAEQRGIKPFTFSNAAKALGIDRSQRKGSTGHFWTLSEKPQTFAFGSARPTTQLFLTAYEGTEAAECLANPLTAQLPEAAYIAPMEAEHAKSSPTSSSFWPFSGIHFSCLTEEELIRMLRTVEDPFIIHLVQLLAIHSNKPEPENETESKYDEGYCGGYDMALSEVEIMLRDEEGAQECSVARVKSVFTALHDRIAELRSKYYNSNN